MNGISLQVISGMMLLDIQNLLIFKHIADLYSILRATEKLDYVQSNVSQQMKILENEPSESLQKFIRFLKSISLNV